MKVEVETKRRIKSVFTIIASVATIAAGFAAPLWVKPAVIVLIELGRVIVQHVCG
jgi:hypothetical protein